MQDSYQKERLRKKHKELRNGMDSREAAKKSSIICQRMHDSDWYASCNVIFGYYPLGKEVNPLPLLKQAFADGKTVALPRTEVGSCQMDFYQIRNLAEVSEGAFHVMEPLQTCSLIVPESAEKPEISYTDVRTVVLVPGVVFDKSGKRYGYGKGYYDRYFARFPQCRKFALAYEHQLEQELETLDTDIQMDRIYTDVRIYNFEG